MKPCIAFLLDGNLTGERHQVAFVLAIECRRLGLSESGTADLLRRWARKVGYRELRALRAIANAFARTGAGGWRYYPPGLVKKPGGIYAQVLEPICVEVDCPAKCGPFSSVHRGARRETFQRFQQLGWPALLRRQRKESWVDFYRAICEIELARGIAPGGPLLVSYKQLGERAGRDQSKAGNALDGLRAIGLISEFKRGSGSGPHARDRRASRVVRAVPIPRPPPTDTGAITTGCPELPQIGGERQPIEIGGLATKRVGGDDDL